MSPRKHKISINKELFADFRKVVVWSCRLAWGAAPCLLGTVFACFLIESLIPAASTAAIGMLVNKLKGTTDQGSVEFGVVTFWLGMAVSLLALEYILREVRNFARQRLIDETGVSLQKTLYQHTARMDLAYFEESETLNRLFRASSGSGGGAYAPVQNTLSGLSGIIQLASLFGLMIYLEPVMASLLCLAAVPLIVVKSRSALEKYKLDVKTTQRKRLSGYYTSLLAGAANIPSTKLLNLTGVMIERFETTARSIIAERRKLLRTIGLRLGLSIIVNLAVLLFVAGWLSYRFGQGALESGALVAFILAAFRAMRSNAQISSSMASGAESVLSIIPVLEFLDEEPKIKDVGGLAPASLHGELLIKDLVFSYPQTQKRVIDDFSVQIPAGQKVAIVGRNGAGKSTLIKLIARFYDTDAGSICIDGTDLKDYSLRWLHDHIAMVFQRPAQYEASVYDNIAFGDWQKLKGSPDEIRNLAIKTGLVGFVDQLPGGFETHLGRLFGEVTLSEGQWQLLAITRALARKDSILILDEPTSSLDAVAESKMFEAIKDIAGDRTVLFVSHKVSTVREADRILVMDEGRLVEDGTHEELIALDGYYSSMNRHQQKDAYLK